MEQFPPHTIQPGSEAAINLATGHLSPSNPQCIHQPIGRLGSATHSPEGQEVPKQYIDVFALEQAEARAALASSLTSKPHPFAHYYNPKGNEAKQPIHLPGDTPEVPSAFRMGHMSRDKDPAK